MKEHTIIFWEPSVNTLEREKKIAEVVELLGHP